jgi:PAS domain S-box-containing protein
MSTETSSSPSSEIEALRSRLAEAEDTLRAIRLGEVDALIVQGDRGDEVYTLRSADQPYRILVEQMREGALVLAVTGDILYANQRVAELVHCPPEELVGHSFLPFLDEDDRDTLRRLAAAGGGSDRVRLRRSDGRTIDAYVSLTVTMSDGVARHSVILADLTELLDAQAGRARAERESLAKDEFMAMLAHELRNPLGAISGAVQVLNAAPGSERIATRARDVIVRQVAHLSRLIDDLLGAGRLVTGKVHIDRRPVDLGQIVRRSVSALTVGGHLDRQVHLSVEEVWAHADAVRLEQVFGNLLGNAVKYTVPGGHIAVNVSADGTDAVIRVDDDGAGIEPALLPRVFDLFVQGNPTLDRPQGGLGIGLTLVRRLVELHGGTVTATSAGRGRGSAFTVRLPRIEQPTESVRTPARGEAVSRRRVLVIEDNTDARDMCRLALELAGHDVIEAPDGSRGLELLRSSEPDVALIDIGLPHLDGYEVARRYRASPGRSPAVLVALTGYGADSDRQRAFQAGFDHHLTKPVSAEAVRALMAQVKVNAT